MRLHSFLTTVLDGSEWFWGFYSDTFNMKEVGLRVVPDIL